MEVPSSPFPKTLREFQAKFATEEACQEYLAACRWPDGFVCPRCGNRRAYELAKLSRRQCAGCRYQVSLTVGTILHNTKTPLTVWFCAAYMMATDERGVSALLLQRQMALRRSETAWMMLHKLRRAVADVLREPLQGEVEIDATSVGGPQAGLRGSRRLKGPKAALVIVAVEKRGDATDRARMAVIPDFKAATLTAFLKQNVAPGSTLYTEGLLSGKLPEEAGFKHEPQLQSIELYPSKGGQDEWRTKTSVPLANRAIGDLQEWLIGTHHGVSRGQLQVYLDEFVFRYDHRGLPMAAFRTLLGIASGHKPTAYNRIRGAADHSKKARRRLTPNPK